MAQRSPNHLTVAATSPEPGGALEVMVGKVLDDGQGGNRLLEQVEDQPDCLLDVFVGVEDDPALQIVDEARGRPEPEFATGCFLQLAAQRRERSKCSSASLMVPRNPRRRRSEY